MRQKKNNAAFRQEGMLRNRRRFLCEAPAFLLILHKSPVFSCAQLLLYFRCIVL